MPVVVVRYRPWLHAHNAQRVREWLLVGSDGALTFPPAFPAARFAGRVISLSHSIIHGTDVYVVASGRAPEPLRLRRADLLADTGVWAVDDDFVAKGAIPPLGIPGQASVFDVPIAADALRVWAVVAPALPPPDVAPVAVYHGTDWACVDAICAEGLRPGPNPGMLGPVVSVGSFWKATRYASRTNVAWAWRARGAVFRAYLDVGRCRELDGSGPQCACDNCVRERAHVQATHVAKGLPPAHHHERWRVVDCAGTWLAHYDTAHVPLVVLTGPCADGRVGFANTNEEYGVARPAERLELQAVAELDLTTMARPHWDAAQRSQRIA